MELQPLEQAAALIQGSRAPVIIIPPNPSTDALAASLALLVVIERIGKNARIVSPDYSLPPGHGFLPKSQSVERNLSSLRSFIISVDVSKTKLEALSYDIVDNKLHIYLAPKNGFFEPKDVTTSAGAFAYDLIILLDVPSVQQLGSLHEENAEFFYQTPILNIDHHSSNSRFGHVNLVDVVASSVSEIIFELVKRIGYEQLDEQISTSLLTGIISKTKAFQGHSVTPRSLAIASHLISAGARRDHIIRNLYQTKTLPMLKLWGRALAKIQSAEQEQIVWSSIAQQDLRDAQATPPDAIGVLDELMVNTPTAKYVLLLIETRQGVAAHLNQSAGAPDPKLPSQIKRQSAQHLTGTLPGLIKNIEQEIITALRASLRG